MLGSPTLCDEEALVLQVEPTVDVGMIMDISMPVDQTLNHPDYFFYGVGNELLLEVVFIDR